MTAGRRPRLIWTVNIGQILSSGVSLIAILTVVWNIAVVQTRMQMDIDAGKARAAIYGPKLEAVEQIDKVQDERIGSLTATAAETRQALSRLSDKIGDIAVDTAAIKASIKAQARP